MDDTKKTGHNGHQGQTKEDNTCCCCCYCCCYKKKTTMPLRWLRTALKHASIQAHAPIHPCARSSFQVLAACSEVAGPEEVEAVTGRGANHAGNLRVPVQLLDVSLARVNEKKLRGQLLLEF
jgi:hypothetical protein